MSSFLTILRDGTAYPWFGLQSPDWHYAPDATLSDVATGPEGKVLVEELIACIDRDESLRDFRPVIILTGRDLAKSGCSSLFGFADQGRRIGVVSSFRLEHPDPARVQARLTKVIRHEIGHLQGRRHCRQPGCLMHPARHAEDLDGRMTELCPRCSRRSSLATTTLHRTGAALFLTLAFATVNLLATLLQPAPMAPFAEAVGVSERLVFDGTPVKFSSSLVDPAVATRELNRLFTILTPPSLITRASGEREASVLAGETEILRVRHEQPVEEATKLAIQLNEILEAKGSRSSLCAECHLERRPEVLEAASGRKWGIGPF